MPRQLDTRRKIIDRAQDLLQERGYNGFSYKDISTHLDMQNAAIHYHFPTKEELGVAVVARERRRFDKWIKRRVIQQMNAWEKLEWFFSIYTHYMDNGEKICIPASLAANSQTISEELRLEGVGLVNDMLVWLTDVLAAGKTEGLIRFDGQAATKAGLIMASVQGGLQTGRILGQAHFLTILENLRAELKP